MGGVDGGGWFAVRFFFYNDTDNGILKTTKLCETSTQ